MSEQRKSLTRKLQVMGGLFSMAFLVVVARAYRLQVSGSEEILRLGNAQHNTTVSTQPQRGAIYDRNGDVLAMDVQVASIGINPHQLDDKAKVYEVLRQFTGLSKKDLDKKINSKKKFEWVRRRIPAQYGAMIEKYRFKGVQVHHEYKRYYPSDELAGQVLGAVGYDARALAGLELSFDQYLKAKPAATSAVRDAKGRLITPLEDVYSHHDLHLTLDKTVQHYAEEALTEYARKHQVHSAFAVVADVQTGEMLALANYPQFNPNEYWEYPQEVWKNRIITDVFEPGSTFKAMVVAGALDQKLVKPMEKVNCEGGNYRIKSNVIHDHHGYGMIPVRQVFQVSSNIGVTKLAQKMGRERFYDFIRSLGFGKTSDMGLVGEITGFLRPAKSWKDIELSNISFGQGISTTGMEMVRAYMALVNGGTVMNPFLVKRITTWDGQIKEERQAKIMGQAINELTSEEMRFMMHLVTQPGGTAGSAHIDGYYAGGKTGTAQKFDNVRKMYRDHDYVSSFIGYAPFDKPRFVTYVVYDTPTSNGYYGGIVAAPAFRDMSEKILKYYGVVPGGYPNEKAILATGMIKQVPVIQKKKMLGAGEEATLAQDQTQGSPSDAESLQSPALISIKTMAEAQKYHDQRLMQIQLAFKQGVMPDLKGLSMRRVLQLAKDHGLKIRTEGHGQVLKQSPQQGTLLKQNADLSVQLGRVS